MEELFLIYVNKIGKNYKGKFIYEFIFSNDIKNVDGDEWDTVPASGRPQPPHEIYIKKVGRLESELILDVIQDSDTFAVWDSVDGIIALAFESVNGYDSYPEHRICFHFGEGLKVVESKLYAKDLILEYNNQKHETKN